MKKNRIQSYSYFLSSFIFLTFLSNIALHGQSNHQATGILLSGKIIDATTLEPIKGATVQIEENIRTVTDTQGFFQLKTARPLPITLRITSVGFEDLSYVAESTSVTIGLQPSSKNIDEIVVVGYGTQRRKDLTGSIASVSQKHLEYNVSPSVDVLLGGAIAGVHVTQSSGQPGAPATIRIRGGNSVNASNNPLYVIDGFLFFSDNASTKVGYGAIEGEMNPLSLLNPSDIASIDVLKDVSATAIYGSRGSNGVILITTKKGERGRSLVDYQYSFGTSNSAKRLDLLNASQWARLQKDHFHNKPGYSEGEIAQLGEGYDWQQAVLQKGITHSHSLSISGGDEKSQYFISGNQLDQEGVVLNSGFKRFVGRANYDRQVFPGFKVGVNVTGSKSSQSSLTTFEGVNYNSSPYSAGIANSLIYALYMPPAVPLYNADGSYNYSNPFEYAYLREGSRTANPISDLENSTALTGYSSVLGNFYGEYKPNFLDGLTARVSVGSNLGHTTQSYFSPSYTAIGLEPGGIGGIGHKRSEIVLSEFTLSYVKGINDVHSFDVLGGYTVQNTKSNFNTTLSSGFTNESLGVNNLQDGKPYGARPIFSGRTESDLYSLLGRVNYSFHGRYHLTANFRSDYSSRFAKNHKWGTFPSIGLAWNINEENFFNVSDKFSSLKLRASAGRVGNQEIGDYEYLQTLEAVYYGGNVAYATGNSGNENLRWETTAQYNVGIDAGFLNNRITLAADAYHKRTTDLLLRIPPKLGEAKEQLINVGSLENKGVEFSVNAVAVKNSKVHWSVAANVAHNKNSITELYDGVTERVLGAEILRVGEPLGAFYGQVFEGVIQQGDDISRLPTAPSYNPLQPGDPKLKDVNGDNHINQLDKEILGSKQPRLTYGLSSSVNFKGFDVFVLLQGVRGHSVYNHLRRYLETPNDSYNASAALLDAWTPANPSNTIPRVNNVPFSTDLDSRYIENASFLRVRTITLGYTVGKDTQVANGWLPFRTRLFATAQNPFTLTDYKGYDPEIGSGIDLGAYPMPRTFQFGINVSF